MNAAEVQKSRDAERTRSAILSAAADVFADRGFDGSRIALIADRAEVPTGLLYHYFPSKRALFEATLNQAFGPSIERMAAGLAAADPGIESLERLVRQYFGMLRENPRVARLAAWWYASLGWVESPEPSHAIWKIKEAAVAFVERLQGSGAIRNDADPEGVVLSIIALCQHWHMSHGENLHLLKLGADQDPHEVRLKQIVDVLYRGLRP
jgi:AcrR family transcriptional regulator